jgi:hypothetical protein
MIWAGGSDHLHRRCRAPRSGRGIVGAQRKESSGMRISWIGCMASIVISVVLSVILTVILNFVI